MTAGEPGTFSIESMQSVLTDPANRADPYPFYRKLRSEAPRAKATLFDAWVLSTHADAMAVLRDPRMSSSNRHQPGYQQFAEMVRRLGFEGLLRLSEKAMLFLDPPDHTRIRKLAAKAFTPRSVEAMRPHIHELVDELIGGFADGDEMDVVSTLAYPLPVIVISEMLGVPLEDRDSFHEWTAAAVKVLDPGDDFSIFPAASAAFDNYANYFRELIAKRRKQPGEDLLSALIAAEEYGDRLTEDELISTMSLLFVAGHETTVNLTGNGMLALFRNPDQLARLRDDPSLVPTAVEEMLRYDSPVQLTGRNASEDVEINGLKIRKSQQAVVLLGAANRDPARFQDPERFDVGRTDNHHVAFGGGIHHCLGAPLARVEAQVAIGELLQRFPNLELAVDDPPRKETVTLRGLKALPVSLHV